LVNFCANRWISFDFQTIVTDQQQAIRSLSAGSIALRPGNFYQLQVTFAERSGMT